MPQHYLITKENLLSKHEGKLMESIVIYILLDLQQHWPLQVSSLIILVLHLPPTMAQHVSRKLFQIFAWYIWVFANAVEGLDTRLMPESSTSLNYSHQVLEEILISSTPFMAKNQLIHQYSERANLRHLTSNTGPLLPKPVLWFQISLGDLIIMPLIMVILRLTLQSFQLNITLNLFYIQTPLW